MGSNKMVSVKISLLGKIIRAIFSSKNNRGLALLYVMGALLITTFIGTALMNLSHNDVVSATDYSAMTTAAVSARSSMQACIALFEQQSQQTVDILNNYLDDDYNEQDKGWLQGSAGGMVVLNNQQKYNANILGFDKDNFIVQVEGQGLGKGGSEKKIVGVYYLDGIDFDETTEYGNIPINALHLGNGAGEIVAHIDINGDTYIDNPKAEFCDGSHESHFRGKVVTAEGSTQMTIRGGTFHKGAYFNCPIYCDSKEAIFMEGVGFEKDVLLVATVDPDIRSVGGFFNGDYTTCTAGRIQANNIPVYGWSAKNYIANGGPTGLVNITDNPGAGSTEYLSRIDNIPERLGISCDAPPDVQVFLDDARDYAIDISQVGNPPSGTNFNTKYNSLSSSQLLGGDGGFMVVEGSNDGGGTGWTVSSSGTFTKKLIWIIENAAMDFHCPTGGFFECSNDAIIFLYLKNTAIDNFRNFNKFRGFIYVEGPSDEIHIFGGEQDSEIHGGVYIKDGVFRRQGNSTKTLKIHFEPDVINELAVVGMFIEGGVVTEATGGLILTKTNITSTQLGLHF